MDLDPKQREAVEHGEGPLLIVAGPGSGKTRVLVQRVAHLVRERNVPPDKILVTTFTKKAAEEMRNRLRALIEEDADALWLGTVHSRCLEVLRQKGNGPLVGLQDAFTIADDSDAEKLAERLAKAEAVRRVQNETGLSEDAIPSRDLNIAMMRSGLDAMHSRIAYAKEWNVGPDEVRTKLGWSRYAENVYRQYNRDLHASNRVDFGDMQMLTVQVLRETPNILGWIQRRFQYVLVDEYQDTNAVQAELFKLICSAHRNITVVGDADQCIPAGEVVDTPSGSKKIEDVRAGDTVLALSDGKRIPAVVRHVGTSMHRRVLTFKTDSGETFRCTPNHVVYAAQTRCRTAGYYVYLMWKRGVGWRIGSTSSVLLCSAAKMTRASLEHAERMWILEHSTTLEEAHYKEIQLSLRYRIPTTTFMRRAGESLGEGRKQALFAEFADGEAVLAAYGISFDRPAYLAKASSSGRIAVNVVQAGSQGSQVNVESACGVPDDVAQEFGFHKGKSKTLRLRRWFRSYQEARSYARYVYDRLLAAGMNVYVSERLGIGRQPASTRPIDAVQLQVGMLVVVREGDRYKHAQVVERSEELHPVGVSCYDLEVENIANYFVGGVCVHNSVYAFRGATPQFMLSFAKDWPGTKVVYLDRNYRSSEAIVRAAQAVIGNNEGRFSDFVPTAVQPGGEMPQAVEVADTDVEALAVAGEVERFVRMEKLPFREMAVLYRSHRQSRAVEQVFLRQQIPHIVLGGMPYFARREVQDLLSWLRLLVNRKDDDSFKRAVMAPPRGVGNVTLERLRTLGKSLLDAAADVALDDKLASRLRILPKQRNGLREVAELCASLEWALPEPNLLARLAKETGYLGFLATQDDGPVRGENAAELCSLYAGFDELRKVAREGEGTPKDRPIAFLDWAATELRTAREQRNRVSADGNVVTLMSMHAAKGTEFDAVFVLGCVEGVVPAYYATHRSDDGSDLLDDDGPRDEEGENGLEEERRLLYVAMTRARKHLRLMVPRERRAKAGQWVPAQPSRFLGEAEDGNGRSLVDWVEAR